MSYTNVYVARELGTGRVQVGMAFYYLENRPTGPVVCKTYQPPIDVSMRHPTVLTEYPHQKGLDNAN